MANVTFTAIWDGSTVQLFYPSPTGDMVIFRKSQPPTPIQQASVPTGFAPDAFIETNVIPKLLVAAVNADGRLEVFFTDQTDVLHHAWQTAPRADSWQQDYLESPTDRATDVTVSQGSDGRLEVFYIGPDGNIYRDWQTRSGPWNGKLRFVSPAVAAKKVALAQNFDGRLELFYTDQTDVLYHAWELAPGGDWSGATLLGSATETATAFTVGQNPDGRLEVFYADDGGVLHHNWQSPGGGWSGPQLLGAPTDKAQEIAVITNVYSDPNSDSRNVIQTLEVFYIGLDNVMYHTWQDPNGPGGWSESISGPSAASSRALSVFRLVGGRQEVLYLDDASGDLYCTWQKAPGLHESWAAPELVQL